MTDFRRKHSYADNGKPNQRIAMIGVWDTVGALGIPGLDARFRLPGGLDWQFHDVKLSSFVSNAFHALAIHEHRKEFMPTLWEQSANGAKRGQRLEQVWFTGAHSDVGGGYPETGLSNIPLLWMIDRARECGLDFGPDATERIKADPYADAHDSFSTLYKIVDAVGLHPHGQWRELGQVSPTPEFKPVSPNFESVHDSVVTRFQRVPPLKPEHWPPSFQPVIKPIQGT
jgi:hypothetical protein